MNSQIKSPATILSPRQSAFIEAYTDPASATFGNSYQSARAAGYSDQSARNFTSKRTGWMSDTVGQMAAIQPDEIMAVLTGVIHDETEPTIVRLKAVEMTMRAYSMLVQSKEPAQKVVTLSIDLTGQQQ